MPEQAELDGSLPDLSGGVPFPAKLKPVARFAGYEVLGRLARGGMAEIFLAREQIGRAQRHVVIKRILRACAEDPEFVESFMTETRLAAHLKHPNICHVYEAGEHAGVYFLCMEWVEGVTLAHMRQRLRSIGPFPPHMAAAIMARVAEALHYAHRLRDPAGEPLRIVHRDVSPQNIMVTKSGVVKLLDFGVAKATVQSSRTRTGVAKGKLSYMSPEQLQGSKLDGRSDIFSLGVCLFQLLTGRSPHKRDSEYKTMRAIIEEPTPSIRALDPRLPVELEAIVARAVSKKPADRFPDAAEMADALDRWLIQSGHMVNTRALEGFVHDIIEGNEQALTETVESLSAASPSSEEATIADPRFEAPAAAEATRAEPSGATRASRPSRDDALLSIHIDEADEQQRVRAPETSSSPVSPWAIAGVMLLLAAVLAVYLVVT